MTWFRNNPAPYLDLVREFHDTFEIPTYQHPDDAPLDVHKLRERLIQEEAKEYAEAVSSVDILDALCDIMYVVAGTAITYSTPVTGMELFTNNLPTKALVYPTLRPVLVDLQTGFPCQKQLAPGISIAINYLESIALNHYEFKFYEAFKAVHENNMEKLWTWEEYNVHQSKCTLALTPKGDKYLVRDLGGKIVKPPSHKKVDLIPYI